MYEVKLSRKAQKFYEKANDKTVRLLNRCFESLSGNPHYHPNIKRLHGGFEGSLRYRTGRLRVIYAINESEKVVYIEVIVSRKNAY